MNYAKTAEAIGRIRDFYRSQFECSWFYLLAEDLPLDPLIMKDLRSFLETYEHWRITPQHVAQGIKHLETFIMTVRKYLLPVIKEKLRISHLKPAALIRDRSEVAIRQLVAYATPLNLDRLEELTDELKQSAATMSEQLEQQADTALPISSAAQI